MSWRNNPLIDLISESIIALIKDAWKSITGSDKLDKDTIEKIRDIILEDLSDNFQKQINTLSLQLGMMELNDRTIDVLDAFEVHGTFPKLGIEVEEITEDNNQDLTVYDLAEKVSEGRDLSKAAYIEIAKELLKFRKD